MVLWVDKHRPKSLDALDYHQPLSKQLKRLVAAGDFPHMLMYGPSGAGKKTRIMALLREMYGPGAERLKVEHRSFKVGTNTVELSILTSPHHIELNPSDAGIRDREIVQEVIKEIAQTAPVIGAKAKMGFKLVVLNEVERLSKPAQHALRRTMEKYMATCRLLFCCTNPCKVIAPIRSRCVSVRVAAPTHAEVCSVLSYVAGKEGIKLPQPLALRISEACDRNLRRAILAMEACRVSQYPLTDAQPVALPDWQLYIQGLAEDILREQTPKQLLKVRARLYELLSNCIPPETVLAELTKILLERIPLNLRGEILHHAANFEHRMQEGQKPIFHLEGFIARFMAVYKRALHNSF